MNAHWQCCITSHISLIDSFLSTLAPVMIKKSSVFWRHSAENHLCRAIKSMDLKMLINRTKHDQMICFEQLLLKKCRQFSLMALIKALLSQAQLQLLTVFNENCNCNHSSWCCHWHYHQNTDLDEDIWRWSRQFLLLLQQSRTIQSALSVNTVTTVEIRHRHRSTHFICVFISTLCTQYSWWLAVLWTGHNVGPESTDRH